MSNLLKALYILSWIPVAAIKLALVLLGLIMVPVCLATTGGNFSGIFWLWGNDEEGCPDWWLNHKALDHSYTKIFPRFWWYAVRNPVNNMRFIFDDREDVGWETNFLDRFSGFEAADLLKAGQPSAFIWVYSGPFAGYRRVWLNGLDKYSEIWFGWKLGSGVPGLGFTTQVRLKRKIGT